MEGHHSSIWNYKYPWQDSCLRALYMGPCACRASAGPPAHHLHCNNCHRWGVTLRFLLSANLPKEPGCLPPCGPHQSHHWKSHFSQPGATGSSPDRNLRRVCPWSPERLHPGWIKPPGFRRLAWGEAKMGQAAADHMRTPVSPQWPGPGKDFPNQTSDWIGWQDTFQRVLPVNTPICMMMWRPISRRCWP